MPLSTLNDRDTFNIGDTLWIKADFSDDVKDYESGDLIKVENFDFNTILRFHKLEYDSAFISGQPGGFDYFKVIQKTGECSPYTDKSASLEFVYSNNQYKIEFGLIPNQSGVFSFHTYYNTGLSDGRENEVNLTESKCREIMSFIRYYINNGNNNFHIREQHADLSNQRDDIQKHTIKDGSYSFVVR